MLETPTVQAASSDRKDDVYRTLMLAFAADPMMRWSMPDGAAFTKAAPLFFDAYGGRAFEAGTALVANGGEAAALWLPPGTDPDSEGMAAVAAEFGSGERLEQAAPLFEQMAAYHPEGPCWYLTVLGADPAHMGRGLGGALLAQVLETCDARGDIAYLESSNPRNISLYERHGFEVMGRIQVETSPVMTPMIRMPRAAR